MDFISSIFKLCLVELFCFLGCFLGCFIYESGVDAGKDSAERSANNICWVVVQARWRSIRINGLVEQFLEYGLHQCNGWVDGSATEPGSDHDCRVQACSDGDSIDWHVLRAVMLHDGNDNGHEQEGHEDFDPHHFHYVVSTVVASACRTKLRDVVGRWRWKHVGILWLEFHGQCRQGHAENGTDDLAEDYDQGEEQIVNPGHVVCRLAELFHKHAHCNSRIKMTSADWSEHLGKAHNGQADCDRRVSRGATPVDCNQQEACAQ